MKPVFISYSRDDSEFVNRLRDDLSANSVNIWIDQTGLKPGTRNWEQALRDALRDAHALVLVATSSSRQSNYVQGELEIAEMYDCPVYPVWAAGDDWADCIPLALIKMQYIDARGDAYKVAVPQLVEALGQVPVTVERTELTLVLPDFEPRNPYKGLRAFREDDADDFFGREALIEELVEALRKRMSGDRLLAVIGPSGSGKSSVVMAGLLPRLRKGALPTSAEWVYLDPIVPGARPLESLSITLSDALNRANTIIRQDLDDPEGRGLHILGRQIVGQTDRRLLLVIDQFEELFTQTVNDDERRQFIMLLVAAVSEPKGPVTVILTLRADFYDRPMEYPALFDRLQPHHPVPPMSIDDLRDVIVKPAALSDVQVQFEEGLVGDLLFEVRERVGGLPLLQFTLDQLFEQRANHLLTLDAYREIGGLGGALARQAETTYAALKTDDHRRLARTLFLRLIEPGATELDTTRRRANMSELELSDAAQTQMLREVADAFVSARLLTTGEIAGKAAIEVSHEALIREWEQLGDWLDKAREDIIIQQDVSSDAAAWIERGRKTDDDLLYRGTILEERLAWAARNKLSKDEQAFLDASQQREMEVLVRERQRQRSLRQARVAIGLVIIIALTLIALAFFIRSENQAREADRLATQISLAGRTLTPIPLTIAAASAELSTTVFRGTASSFELQRFATLAAGEAIMPAAQTGHNPGDILKTATKIANFSSLDKYNPVIDEAYKTQYGVEMVQAPAGCFWMGRLGGRSEQRPVHEVCFDEPFWIDRFEVTNEQFERLGGEAVVENPWLRPDQPRANITWFEASDFCQRRGAQLPTEAQWEYAARGPDSLVYPWGNEFVEENVVYTYNNSEEPADVGEDHRPDGVSWIGVYDMSGNVSEWVADWYSNAYYAAFDETIVARNPKGPSLGEWRVMRGGGFSDVTSSLQAAYRNYGRPSYNVRFVGFRCARPAATD